jgi:hypothetical protein
MSVVMVAWGARSLAEVDYRRRDAERRGRWLRSVVFRSCREEGSGCLTERDAAKT